MTDEQYSENLSVPRKKVDVVLDTDTYNEIDDQYALAYLLRSTEKLCTKAIYAAPFFNAHSESPEDGMEKSYLEIRKILSLMNEEKPVFKGSRTYLPDEKTAVDSDAARDLAARAKCYSPENPLYVAAIGAITDVASAILIDPTIAENIVVVALGGHAFHYGTNDEFNLRQDVAAYRVVLKSGAPFVHLPCMGVVSAFTVSEPEFSYWFEGKNPLADYLYRYTVKEARRCSKNRCRSRCIWDVTAIAWLLNDGDRFMSSRLEPIALPTYDFRYDPNRLDRYERYVYDIHRDELLDDLVRKIADMNPTSVENNDKHPVN